MNIGIIGIGNIGGTLARLLLTYPCKRLVLYDEHPGTAYGKCLDLQQVASIMGQDSRCLCVAESYRDMRECEVIVITAGLARKPGMDRSDLLKSNAVIISKIGYALQEISCVAHIIVVTNPVDIMSWWLQRVTGFESRRILGMAGVLDTGRFRGFLAKAQGVCPSSIGGIIMGPHNEDMFVLSSSVTVGGLPFFHTDILETVVQETREAGAKIVEYLERGSAFFAPAEAIRVMIEAIVYDRQSVLPCSVSLEGGYEQEDIYCGMPVLLGKRGVEKVYQPLLTKKEHGHLMRGIEKLRDNQNILSI